ncbi:MAG: TetR/AcrR family transcriptional regulator [Parvularculaceae bacterium]|nr:TetR/AcrR family transcriptional regulator [Parvularculaceae bacterium]
MTETANPAPPLDETAKAILDAASKRFLHYGYGKTTMSEIAGDCNMSTGNVYRYYPSKLDIAEAFVRRLRADQIARLREVIAQPGLGPNDKIRRFFQTKLRLTFDRFHNRPKAFELSAEILKERPDFANEWEKAEAAVLVGILEEGEKTGAMAVSNRARTARILQDAAFRFTSSSVFFEGEYDDMSAELDDVLDLILDGFAHRAGKCAPGD